MITIVDSGIANLGSVCSAFQRVGAPVVVTRDPEVVRGAAALLLPGVGSFGDGMASLRRHRLVDPIRDAVDAGVPLLGICLGMQLLADSSEEFGEHQGLGLIPGRVTRLRPILDVERVPNIGWCDQTTAPHATLFGGVPQSASFYFVHSYHLVCGEPTDTVGTIGFGGGAITTAVERGQVFGAQFHPEKSQDTGLTFLDNFANLVRRRSGTNL